MSYSPDSVRESERPWAMIALAGVGLLTALRIVGLWFNETDLFFDEAQYWFWGQDFALGYFSKPPMIGWLIGSVTEVCGDGPFCVRLPAPVLHSATAMLVYAIGRRLYDGRTGCLAALAYATLPGVSLGASLISTDSVLLVFWALALLAFVAMERAGGWLWPVLFGVALGGGLMSKYAMAYVLLGLVIAAAMSVRWRRVVLSARFGGAVLLGLALFAPNLWWNATQADNATLRHTADNANWGADMLNPGEALAFFGAQFGVFGPVLFGALLVLVVVSLRGRAGLGDADRLLMALSVPILLIVTVQAFLSRAHANWAATAYVAASLLVVATLLRWSAGRWTKASFAVNGVAAALILLGAAVARDLDPPVGKSPYDRTLGWAQAVSGVGDVVTASRGAGAPYAVVIGGDRKVTAELFYYLRDMDVEIRAWKRGGPPGDHYELVAGYDGTPPGPALVVLRDATPGEVALQFGTFEPVGEITVPASPGRTRVFHLFEGHPSAIRPE